MATRMFCDRCGADVTEEQTGSIGCIENADEEGNGSITSRFDLCVSCYAVAIQWLKTLKPRRRVLSDEDAANQREGNR